DRTRFAQPDQTQASAPSPSVERGAIAHSPGTRVPGMERSGPDAPRRAPSGWRSRSTSRAAAPAPPVRRPIWMPLLVLGFVWLLGTGGWLVISLLLAHGSGQRWGMPGLGLTAWMAGGLTALYLSFPALPTVQDVLPLLGAFFAALAAGLVFAFHRV